MAGHDDLDEDAARDQAAVGRAYERWVDAMEQDKRPKARGRNGPQDSEHQLLLEADPSELGRLTEMARSEIKRARRRYEGLLEAVEVAACDVAALRALWHETLSDRLTDVEAQELRGRIGTYLRDCSLSASASDPGLAG